MMNFSYLGHEITLEPAGPQLWQECNFDCPEHRHDTSVLICSQCVHEHHTTLPHYANHDARRLELRQIAFEHVMLHELKRIGERLI